MKVLAAVAKSKPILLAFGYVADRWHLPRVVIVHLFPDF